MSNIWSFPTLYKYGTIFSHTGQCVHKCKYLRIVQSSVQCASSLPTTFWHFDLLRCASLHTSCISDIYRLKKITPRILSERPLTPISTVPIWSLHTLVLCNLSSISSRGSSAQDQPPDQVELSQISHLTLFFIVFSYFWTSWILKFWPLFRDWRKDKLWSPKNDAIHAKTTQSFVEGSFWRTGKLCKTQMDNCLNSRVSHLSNNKRLRS